MRTPGPIEIGSEQHLTMVFVNDAGVAFDPTTVIFRTRSPCGIENSYTYGVSDVVGKSAVGYYFADITPNEAGRWTLRWQTTGPVFAIADFFNVQTSDFAEFNSWSDYV